MRRMNERRRQRCSPTSIWLRHPSFLCADSYGLLAYQAAWIGNKQCYSLPRVMANAGDDELATQR